MNKKYSLKIAYLYGNEMNIYGDYGNIITLKKRCEWRNIDVEIININKGKINDKDVKSDIYFMGGGQDNDMYQVFDDMIKHKKEFLKNEVNNNKVFLLICGAFQLFGEYFLDSMNRTIKGLGILPIETKAPGSSLNERCLGNLYYNLNENVLQNIKKFYKNPLTSIVGFENHSGQTFFLNDKISENGKVVFGKGNNSIQNIEGGNYKNIFGSYTHGSMLPKNPHFTDMLIGLALQNKYGNEIKLEKLDDSIEWYAHENILKRLSVNI